MNPNVKNLFRGVTVFLAAAAMVAFPVLWIPAAFVIGLVGYNLLFSDRSGKSRAEKMAERRMNKREMKLERALRRERRRTYREHFSNVHGWKAESFPPGMVANVGRPHDASITLDACGVKGLVTATRDGLFTRDRSDTDRVMFSFPLQKESQAMEVKEMIESSGSDAKLVRGRDGVFRVQTRDAYLCASLAQQVWPQQNLEFSREVVGVRQYVVEGCASFEEAQRKFEENRGDYAPVNCFTTMRTSLGGETVSEESSGRLLDRASVVTLPTGAYVVTESSVTADSALIRIPGDLHHPEDVARFACSQFENNLVERGERRTETVLADGTPEGVARSAAGHAPEFSLGAAEFDAISELGRRGLKAWVMVDSVEALRELASGGQVPGGAMVSLGYDAPRSPQGGMVVEIPVDSREMVLRLGGADGEQTGVGTYAEMLSRLESEDMITVRSNGGIPLAGARVDGMEFVPLGQRVCSDRLDAIGIERLKDWMRDAAQIQSVTYTIDPAKEEMRITTTVDGASRTERLPLSGEDIRALEYRGVFSKTELKDFVLQTHPEYFRTYAAARPSGDAKVRSIYKDPARDFVRGVRPERRSSASAAKELKEERKNKLKEERKNTQQARRGGVKF